MAQEADIQKLVAVIEARSAAAEKEMAKFVKSADRRMRQAEAANRRAAAAADRAWQSSFDRIERQSVRSAALMTTNFNRMRTAASFVGVGLSARELTRLADGWTDIGNQIGQYQNILGDTSKAQNRFFDLASASRQKAEALSVPFAAATRAAVSLGRTGDEVFAVTEAIGKGAAIANTGAAAVDGALTQLGQAIASPRVQLQEFNSVIEGTPRLAKAFADGVKGANGDIAKLRQMIANGEVSGSDLFNALLSQLPALRAEFAKTQSTIAGSINVVINEFTRFIGQAADATGAAQAIVAIFNAVAHNANLLGGAIVALCTILLGRFAAVAITGAVQSLGSLILATTGASAAFAGLGGAGVRATTSLSSRMLGFFGGPIGALITAVGLAVGYFVSQMGSAAEAAEDYAAKTTQISDALATLEQAYRNAAAKTETFDDATKRSNQSLLDSMEATTKANAAANLRTIAMREQTIATLRAAQAMAYLRAQDLGERMESSRSRIAMLTRRRDDYKHMADRGSLNDQRLLGETEGELSKEVAAINEMGAAFKMANENATTLWNGLQDIMSGKIDLPEPKPDAGGGGGGKGFTDAEIRSAVLDAEGEVAKRRAALAKQIAAISAAYTGKTKDAVSGDLLVPDEKTRDARIASARAEAEKDIAAIEARASKAGATADKAADRTAVKIADLKASALGGAYELQQRLGDLAVADFERATPFSAAQIDAATVSAQGLAATFERIDQLKTQAAKSGQDISGLIAQEEINAAAEFAQKLGSITLAIQALDAAAAADPGNAARYEAMAGALRGVDQSAAVAAGVLQTLGDNAAQAERHFQALALAAGKATPRQAAQIFQEQVSALEEMASATGTAGEALALLYSMRPPAGADAASWAQAQIAIMERIRQAAANSGVVRTDAKGAAEQRDNDLYLRTRDTFMSAARDGINALEKGDFKGFLRSFGDGIRNSLTEAMMSPIDNFLKSTFDQLWKSGFGDMVQGLGGMDIGDITSQAGASIAQMTGQTAAMTTQQVTATASLTALTAAANAAAIALANVGGGGGGGGWLGSIGKVLGLVGGGKSAGASSGGGNWLSGIGKGLGIGGHARGGSMRPGELSWVGEKGPELFRAGIGGTVIPADVSARVTATPRAAARGGDVYVGGATINIAGSADGGTVAALRKELMASEQRTMATISALQRDEKRRVIGHVNDGVKRRAIKRF